MDLDVFCFGPSTSRLPPTTSPWPFQFSTAYLVTTWHNKSTFSPMRDAHPRSKFNLSIIFEVFAIYLRVKWVKRKRKTHKIQKNSHIFTFNSFEWHESLAMCFMHLYFQNVIYWVFKQLIVIPTAYTTLTSFDWITDFLNKHATCHASVSSNMW